MKMHKVICVATCTTALVLPASALADQGGIGFWLPGIFGSLAATPGEPGWAAAGMYLHSSVSADGNLQRGVQIAVGLDGTVDVGAFGPVYTLEQPVLDGQLSLSVLGIGGYSEATVEATLTGPGGGQISGSRTESLTGWGDVFAQGMLKWNDGTDNYLAYGMAGIPVGAYDSTRLVNLGLGHGAIDFGGGYTYLNPKSGWEFSAVAGLTYNFENQDIDYQNGIDAHLDWGASYFIDKETHIGLVGYAYQQVTGDSGAGATLGDFKSRVFGIGPQVGFLFPVGDSGVNGYLNLKGYKEFGEENRAAGWNAWVSLSFAFGEEK